MALKRKYKIGLGVLSVIGIVGYFIFRIYFPAGPILNDVPNFITDYSEKDHTAQEKAIPQNELKNLYFGDLHVHTRTSFDAYILGCSLDEAQAFQFAMGDTVDFAGEKTYIRRPLDFVAITDHSEFFGEMYSVLDKNAPAHRAFIANMFRNAHRDTAKRAAMFARIVNGTVSDPSHLPFFQGYETTQTVWEKQLKVVEKYYKPGKFTTLAGYEWTFGSGFNMHLHRNVIFRDMKLPVYPISALEAKTEPEFWKSLQYFDKNGATLLAIPHNTNWGNGKAFPDLGKENAQLRNRYEPLIEVHQAKGGSEVSAEFWKNDEFANFEDYNHVPDKRNAVRYALKKGLEQEEKYGTNPYKFGLIGSTDTHTGMPGNTEEDDDKIANHNQTDENANNRQYRKFGVNEDASKVYEVVNPGGLVAVWAKANIRGEIYDALARKETYATSGNRIQLRFFGGFDFQKNYTNYKALVTDGYQKGVPMGGDLAASDKAPQFIVWATKDSDAANLDRIQIIKGWYDGDSLHEKIYTIALSDNRTVSPDGTVPDNGATVNMQTGEWSKDKGAATLQSVWTDPDFNPKYKAFYYARVLEVPTASWRLWDQIRHGVTFPVGTDLVIRERAWSSPIWVK